MEQQATQKPLGQILKDMELVTEGQIQEALSVQRDEGGVMGEVLVDLGHITEDEKMLALGAQVGMEVVDLPSMDIPRDVVEMVEPSMASVYNIMPVRHENGVLTVAMADPMNLSVLDDLRFTLDCEVEGAVSNEEDVEEAIDQYYGDMTESVEGLLDEMEDDQDLQMMLQEGSEGVQNIENLEQMANQKPVVKLLNLVLLQAIKEEASDIHFEPFEEEFKIRYRVDGVLYEMMPPPLHIAIALISRIKVMADMDIAEDRLPQDGRIQLSLGGKPVDIRVSTLPITAGESVVMRVLDRSVVSLSLDKLGLRDDELKMVYDVCSLPNGIVFNTGPTGSGKTTTLYSCLNHLNDSETKIITTEDPVEYDLEGIMQCEIDEEIDLTYASCLRAILRQDPDIILVGEIRDQETAEIAVKAALTGHLVLSTLHTNDAPSAVTRLIDLGIQDFLLAATMEAVFAQRLVRRICPNCKEYFKPTEDMLFELNLKPEDVEGKKFARGAGCKECNHSGYKGLMGIFEMMIMTDKIRQLIVSGASTDDIKEAAKEQGMRSLRESGLLAIYDGLTTMEEVVKATMFGE